MATVYILKSVKNGRYYIGSTSDLKRRLREHNLGKTKSLRFTRPYEVVFSREFESIIKAVEIENRLKKLKSRVILDRIIKDQIIKLGP